MTQTSDRTIESQYQHERFVKPLLIEADKAQDKFRDKLTKTTYEWSGNYGDGEKLHTENIIEAELVDKPKEKDWIDNCLRPIPPTDYARWKALERDIHYFDEELVMAPDYSLMAACLYFFVWYPLPLIVLLYLA